MHGTLKTIIADDHPLFREAMKQALERSMGRVEFFEAGDMSQLQLVTEQHPEADLILLDLHMPGVQGFSALVYLRAHHPELPVVVISANEDVPIMRRALEHGAAAFIRKSAPLEEIRDAIQTVLSGEIWVPEDLAGDGAGVAQKEADIARRLGELTPQQFRVLMMLGEGMLNKQIAYDLDISEATVKAHVTAIFRKLGVQNRTQAVLAAGHLAVESPPEMVGHSI